MEPRTPPKDDPDNLKYSEGQAFFKNVSGLNSEQEVVDYQEGGVNDFTRKIVGKLKFPVILIVLGAMAILAAGLIGLGILFDGCPSPAQSSTNRTGDRSFFIDETGILLGECPPATTAPVDNPSTDNPEIGNPATENPSIDNPPSASGCTCAGVDQICTQADGTQTVSYNATACGGSGECQCREPNKTLACPDGTYADFNPQCGVGGGGQCTCVCDAYDANQNCVAGHDSCNPQITCLP